MPALFTSKIMRKLLIIICAALLWASTPAAAVLLDQQGCLEYAVWSRDLVWARDVGADREKVRESLIEMRREANAHVGRDASAAGAPVFTLLLRDFDAIWVVQATRHVVAQAVYRDCATRRGQYGEES